MLSKKTDMMFPILDVLSKLLTQFRAARVEVNRT